MTTPTNYSQTRDAIVGVIQSTHPDIGEVHNRFRYGADWKEFLNFMTTVIRQSQGEAGDHEYSPVGATRIRGWMVTRASIVYSEEDSTYGEAGNYRVELYKIRGFWAFNDAGDTDTPFQEMIDLLIAKLDHPESMAAAGAETVSFSQGVAKVEMDIRMFSGVLCHYAEIDYTLAKKSA